MQQDSIDALDALDDEPFDAPLSADAYVQPSARELADLAHRLALPEIPGISYRCPPAPIDERT